MLSPKTHNYYYELSMNIIYLVIIAMDSIRPTWANAKYICAIIIQKYVFILLQNIARALLLYIFMPVMHEECVTV